MLNLLLEMQVSQSIIFGSYSLSTMPSVVSHDIFPWPPVNMHKSQKCCQKSSTVSAESVCKVSSWAIASSGESQHPAILRALWPLCYTKLFTAVLRMPLISLDSRVNVSGL